METASQWEGVTAEYMKVTKCLDHLPFPIPHLPFTIYDSRFTIYHAIVTNEQLAERFVRLANLMEIRGDDPFRIRSYRNAADIIQTWPRPLKAIAEAEGASGLQTIPGVGKAISNKVIDLISRGTFDAWDKLTAEIPETVLDLLKVHGIGLKTAAVLFKTFNVTSIADLKKFAEGGGLDLVDGIGERSAERIRESMAEL